MFNIYVCMWPCVAAAHAWVDPSTLQQFMIARCVIIRRSTQPSPLSSFCPVHVDSMTHCAMHIYTSHAYCAYASDFVHHQSEIYCLPGFYFIVFTIMTYDSGCMHGMHACIHACILCMHAWCMHAYICSECLMIDDWACQKTNARLISNKLFNKYYILLLVRVNMPALLLADIII